MVSVYGLSKKIGNISYYDSTGQSDYSFSKPYSEKTAELIDEEVQNLVETAYKRTLEILSENKDKLTQLADKLLEKEVIFRDDLELIFGKSKFEDELKEEKKISKKNGVAKDKKKSASVKDNNKIQAETSEEDKVTPTPSTSDTENIDENKV